MIPNHLDRILLWVAAAHLAVGLVCLFALLADAVPIMGVHPALKPMKFAFSIGVFLATMAVLVPALSVGESVRRALAWMLALTMIFEMVPIAVQALRGTTSHFNTHGWFDSLLWRTMMVAIVIMTVVMVYVAIVASSRSLHTAAGVPMDPLVATAWRAGLWLFLLAAVSGFSMGGRLRHSVGGKVTSCLLVAIPLGAMARWTLLLLAFGIQTVLALWTLFQAWGGKPVW